MDGTFRSFYLTSHLCLGVDVASEESDPHDFDPSVDLRDYDKINLPVFTCSSRDYIRLKGLYKANVPAQGLT